MPVDLSDLKARLKSAWMDGNWDYFARYLEPGTRAFFDRLPIAPGDRLLDIGCGSGQLCLMAAVNGARATGIDISTGAVEKARARAAAAGLEATFQEADAEALPYGPATFDVVTSLISAIFAPRPEVTAAEMLRVCRPGGVIAMGNWTPDSFMDHMLGAISHYIAPAGMPSPMLWGDEAIISRRLRSASQIRTSRHRFIFRYPFPPSDVVEFFRLYHGPMKRAFDSLHPSDAVALRAELEQLWHSHNRAAGHATEVHVEYLQVIATR